MNLIYSETRYRACDRLIRNLRAEDAMNEADDLGYQFPSSTSQELADALEALTRGTEEAEEVVEEELLQYEWDECVGEWEEEEEEEEDRDL